MNKSIATFIIALAVFTPTLVSPQIANAQLLEQTDSILEPSSDLQANQAAQVEGDSSAETLPAPPPEPATANAASTNEANIRAAGSSSESTRESSNSASSELATLPTEHGYDVLMQGPVHEAFAMPIEPDAQKSIAVVPQPPPAPIRELPPSNKPQGNNVQWIDGYWAFQEEVSDYVWVSGFYRDVPPDRAWTPGYWSETTGGYRWTNGFWSAANGEVPTAEITYLPPPPDSIDNGPSSPPPRENVTWLPGQWVYVGGDYQWQSGYWTNQPDNWIWQPACYVNTPQGYVHVAGYWDYEPQFRGSPYAPVLFRSRLYARPLYTYRPLYPLARSASLLLHLFVRPGYRHYYYGDFYSPFYAQRGYQPWYRQPATLAYGGSPLLGYYNWKYDRYGVDFTNSMRRYDDFFRTNVAARPSIQLSANPSLALSNGLAAALTVDRFDDLVRGRVAGLPFQDLAGRATQTLPGNLAPRSLLDNSRNPGGVLGDAIRGRPILPGNNPLSSAASRLDPRNVVPRNIIPQNVNPGNLLPQNALPRGLDPRSGFSGSMGSRFDGGIVTPFGGISNRGSARGSVNVPPLSGLPGLRPPSGPAVSPFSNNPFDGGLRGRLPSTPFGGGGSPFGGGLPNLGGRRR